MSAGINEIENPGWRNETSKGPARRGVPLRCSRVVPGKRSPPPRHDRGSPMVREGRKGPPLRAGDETNKSKFAKRTWNVRWNQGHKKTRSGKRWARRRVKGGLAAPS